MVPEKKPIDSVTESVIISEEEALEQANAANLEEEFFIDENTLIFSDNKGMICKKRSFSDIFARVRNLIIVSVLAVVFLLGTLWTVFALPEEIAQNNIVNSSIAVKQIDSNTISKIVVNGEYGELVFTSKMVEEEGSKIAEWTLEGFEKALIASSSVNAAADSLATMYANRILENDQSKKAAYGFNEPLITADITMRDGSAGYQVLVGKMAPDHSGYYVTVTDDPKIYLVSAGTIGSFNKAPEAFANTVIIETPTKENMAKKTDAKYFDESGALTTFDSIEVSGTKYSTPFTLKPYGNSDFAKYSIDLGDHTRVADDTVSDEMLGLLTNGLVAIDTYKLLPTDADIKNYGLDNPQIIVKLKYGSGYTEVRASLYEEKKDEAEEDAIDDGDIHYAVMISGKNAIYSVLSDAVTMFDYDVEDFYNQFAFLEYIYEFTNLDITTTNGDYSFDIKHNTADDTFTASANGEKVDDTLLSTYFQHLLTLAPEGKESYIDAEPAYTATLTYKDTEKGKKVIELIKQTDRRYLVRIDGKNYGVVNSSNYDHLVVYAKNVIKGDSIPEP